MSDVDCWCEACKPQDWNNMRMIVCSICGNKRCPHATNHINECTGSNEPGQKGSSWENYKVAETSNIKTVEIVKIYPTKYWVEKDFFGGSHIIVQHEGMHAFEYASFNYDYAYTSNAGVHSEIVNMMKRFGIEEKDIEWKSRMPKMHGDEE